MSKTSKTDRNAFGYHVVTRSCRILVTDVVERHLDNAAILACKQCKNYGTVWTCPPFDFEIKDHWKQYTTLVFQCDQAFIDADLDSSKSSPEEIEESKMTLLKAAKDEMVARLLKEEAENPASEALFPGSCWKCKGGCRRKIGESCIDPRFLRPSIEALGGNNVTLVREVFGLEFQWTLPGEIPDYYILTGGLLIP